MLSYHEWLLVAGTLYDHDRMMMDEKEKETMQEDTFVAAKTS